MLSDCQYMYFSINYRKRCVLFCYFYPRNLLQVSCEPDFVIHERTDNDEMLLLACDGLWDVMSNEEAVKEMRNIFADGGNVMSKVCEEMLDIALHAGK